MLYKSSDADSRPNLTVLSQLIEQHGRTSDQVQAFLDLYADNEEFMRRASSLMSSKLAEECEGDNNESSD